MGGADPPRCVMMVRVSYVGALLHGGADVVVIRSFGSGV
jgi:hypothetical protein